MRRVLVLILFVAALAAAGVLAAGRARSLEVSDTSPPVGTVSLPAVVSSDQVTLQVRVSDPESLVTQVRASNDDSVWSEWTVPPSPGPDGAVALPWRLAPGDGTRTVFVEVRNQLGLTSAFTATTSVDTAPPTLVSTEPAGGAVLAAPPAVLVLHYSEPLAASPAPTATLAGGPPLKVAVSGSDVRLTPESTILPNASYSLVVDNVRDLAGNTAAPASLDFSIDPVPATVKVNASAPVVTYGATVTLRGTVAPPGAQVALSALLPGAADYTPLATVTAGGSGRFSFVVKPATNATFKVAFAGDGHYTAGEAMVAVRVRPVLTFAATPEFWLGDKGTFRGRVSPAKPGSIVIVQRRLAGHWVNWRTVTLDSASRYRFTWKPTRYGLSRFRAVWPADGINARAYTSMHRVIVDNPNPHHISVLFKHFIVVDLSECHLYYYENGRVVVIFDCVVGKPSTPTPVGQWTVYQKVVGMWGPYGPFTMWYHYPYHFGIHGTNEPWLLQLFPRHFSHGCTRLSNDHISWLFPRVPVGTTVRNIP